MGAGSLIIAMHHEQDIFKMGGLKKRLPLLYAMMLIATLALSALPPFVGFFSKDAILAHTFGSSNYLLYLIGLLTSGLTAFYMFRLIFVVFYHKQSAKELHVVSNKMVIPMLVLTFFTIVGGLFNLPKLFGGSEAITHWLNFYEKTFELTHSVEYLLIGINITFILFSIYLASRFYKLRKVEPNLAYLSEWIVNKFYIDAFYKKLFVTPLLHVSRVMDRYINHLLIDNFIIHSAFGYFRLGVLMQRINSGNVRHYLLYILVGISLLSSYLLLVMEL